MHRPLHEFIRSAVAKRRALRDPFKREALSVGEIVSSDHVGGSAGVMLFPALYGYQSPLRLFDETQNYRRPVRVVSVRGKPCKRSR